MGKVAMPEVEPSSSSDQHIAPVELRERALLAGGVIETLLEQGILHFFEIGPTRTDMFDVLADRLTSRDKIDILAAIVDDNAELAAVHTGLRDRLIRLRTIVKALSHGYSLAPVEEGVFDIRATRYGRTREYQIDAEEFLGELSAVTNELAAIVSFWKDRSAPFLAFLVT
jgi:hypothetical protein